MKRVKTIAWSFIAADAAVLLFQFILTAQTTTREGQQGWAQLISILTAMIFVAGYGVFALGNHRKSSFVVGLAVVILGIPLIIGILILFDELM